MCLQKISMITLAGLALLGASSSISQAASSTGPASLMVSTTALASPDGKTYTPIGRFVSAGKVPTVLQLSIVTASGAPSQRSNVIGVRSAVIQQPQPQSAAIIQYCDLGIDEAQKLSEGIHKLLKDAENWRGQEVGFREVAYHSTAGLEVRLIQKEDARQIVFLCCQPSHGIRYRFTDLTQVGDFDRCLQEGLRQYSS